MNHTPVHLPIRVPPKIKTLPGSEEALISVVARTAANLGLSVQHFLNEVLGRALNVDRYVKLTYSEFTSNMLGPGDVCNRWISTMNDLTGTRDHADFTLQDFGHLWTRHGLKTRRHRAWCPDCYRSDVDEGHAPYDRQAWFIEAVAICHIHRRALIATCHGCGRDREIVDQLTYHPGICSYCRTWLGDRPTRSHLDLNSFEYWAAKAWATILAGRQQAASWSLRYVPERLGEISLHLFDGNQRRLGRHLRISKGHVSMALSGTTPLSVDLLLLVSWTAQIDLVQLFSPETIDPAFVQLRHLPVSSTIRKRPPMRADAVAKVRMTQTLSRIENPPEGGGALATTWEEAATEAMVSQDALRTYAGPKAQKISLIFMARQRAQRQWRTQTRLQSQRRALAEAMDEFRRQGRPISRRKIVIYLQERGLVVHQRDVGKVYAELYPTYKGHHKTSARRRSLG